MAPTVRPGRSHTEQSTQCNLPDWGVIIRQNITLGLVAVTLLLSIWTATQRNGADWPICEESFQKNVESKLTKLFEPALKTLKTTIDGLDDLRLSASKQFELTKQSVILIEDNFRKSVKEMQQDLGYIISNAENNFKTTSITLDTKLSELNKRNEDLATGFEQQGEVIIKEMTDSGAQLQKVLDNILENTRKSVDGFEEKQEVFVKRMDVSISNTLSNVEDKSDDAMKRIDQSMKTLEKTSQQAADDIKTKTDSHFELFLERQDKVLRNIESNADSAVQKIQKTSSDVVLSFDKSREETERKVVLMVKTLQAAAEGDSAKIQSIASKAIDNIQETALKTANAIVSSHASSEKKIDESVALLQGTMKATSDDLMTRVGTSIDTLHIAQMGFIGKFERNVGDSIQTLENKSQSVFAVLDEAKTIWKDSITSIIDNVNIDKEINVKKNRQLSEFRSLITTSQDTVDLFKQYQKSVIEDTTDSAQALKTTAEKLNDLSLPLSINDYVTWCMIILGTLYLHSRQSKSEGNGRGNGEGSGGGNGGGNGRGPVAFNGSESNGPKKQRLENTRIRPAAYPGNDNVNAPTGPPRYDVTVVTFTEECLEISRQLFSHTMTGSSVQYRLLTGTLDRSGISPSRGYVVLIGADARNTILEEMDGSSGSRKRVTITALQKTRGDVFVVYLDNNRDVEEPPAGALYNPHLERTSSHPILKALSSRDRLITLRLESWNRVQTEHMTKWAQGLR